MKAKLLFLLFACLLKYSVSFSTHIVGGELTYECLGNNDYRIKLKVYRDCYNGVPGFDNPAHVTVFNSSGVALQTLLLTLPGSAVLPSTINNPCFTPPTNICVEEAIYTYVVNLPPIAGGHTLAYQRCCRNNSILNVFDPGNTGSTYTAFIPGTNSVGCNSNPFYNYFPPIFLCAGVPLNFDHSATDINGDSLVYSLCDPFHGASTIDPMPTTASPPPFSFVSWNSPYSGGYPLSSSPALSINPQTGLLTGTPNMIGQWVVGVCVKEYRNGVFLSENKRDFQFNVVNCPGLVVASIPAQQTFCDGFTVSFSNASYNAWGYHWDFGVTGITTDTSSLTSPNYTYPGSGTYTVTLIANPGTLCADTATSTFFIEPLLAPSFTPPLAQCITNNSFNFSSGGNFGSSALFNWNFGNGGSPSLSNLQNPSGIVFNTTGTLPVTLTISENGCTKNFTDNIIIHPDVQAGIVPQTIFCNGFTFDFLNNSQNATTYLWNFGDPTTNNDFSTLFEPSYTYPDSGLYTVTLIATGLACSDTTSASFIIYPLLAANIIVADTAQCLDINSFDFIAGGSFGSSATFYWDFGPNASIPNSTQPNESGIVFTTLGIETVTLTISENGCTSTKTVKIHLLPRPEAIFTALSKQGCLPLTVRFEENSIAGTPLVYNWDFGDGTGSSAAQPQHTYLNAGLYNVSLMVYTTYGCVDTSFLMFPQLIDVFPLPTAGFDMNPQEASIFEPHITFVDESLNKTSCTLYFGDGLQSDLCDLTHTYPDTGNYLVTQIVFNEYGCSDTATGIIRINPEYRFFVPNTFTPNGDGINDRFMPVMVGVKEYKMQIFDRWGEFIFETTNNDIAWDGRVKGKQEIAQQDVYVYVIEITNVFNKRYSFTGNVNIIR